MLTTGRRYSIDIMPESGRLEYIAAVVVHRLDFRLLRYLQWVIDLDTEESNGTFEPRMSK